MTLKDLGLLRPPKDGPAILAYDIETAPIHGYTWQMYDANVLHVTEWDYMLCFAYKWHGTKSPVKWVGLPQQEDREWPSGDDTFVIERLHGLFDAADVTLAHNDRRFDRKISYQRFLQHGFDPPSPSLSIDTLAEAKKVFRHASNKLNDLGRRHDIGVKTAHHGMQLWIDCMAGDPKAWRVMQKYNRQDVNLLIDWYDLILPWINVPRFNAGQWHQGDGLPQARCSKCGHDKLIKRGFYRTKVSKFQSWQCKRCGGFSRSRLQNMRDREWTLT